MVELLADATDIAILSAVLCWKFLHVNKTKQKKNLLNLPLQADQIIGWLSHIQSWVWIEESWRKTDVEI